MNPAAAIRQAAPKGANMETQTDKFVLTIEMGNAAMSDANDVAEALRELADHLQDDSAGGIRDENGNTVGSWKFVAAEVCVNCGDPREDHEAHDCTKGWAAP
jgi:hypothetical protein